ncbi:MAG: hypothetical protein MZU91_05855 [Desulfosudis oleivorans]|nr:hypothetical protein [Desulfosudis oleivorans]
MERILGILIGFAFYLVDKLFLPGGLIIFDDLDWTLGASPSMKNLNWVNALPDEERNTPQVRKVFGTSG